MAEVILTMDEYLNLKAEADHYIEVRNEHGEWDDTISLEEYESLVADAIAWRTLEDNDVADEPTDEVEDDPEGSVEWPVEWEFEVGDTFYIGDPAEKRTVVSGKDFWIETATQDSDSTKGGTPDFYRKNGWGFARQESLELGFVKQDFVPDDSDGIESRVFMPNEGGWSPWEYDNPRYDPITKAAAALIEAANGDVRVTVRFDDGVKYQFRQV